MKSVHIAMLLWLLFGLTACAGRGEQRSPLDHDLGPLSTPQVSKAKLTLNAPVWLWDDKIHYRLLYRDASAVRYYPLDRWAAPLPALLERRLSGIDATRPLVLRLELTQFEQRLQAPDDAQALIELTANAYCGADDEPLASRWFHRTLGTTANVAGAVTGLGVLSDHLRSDIQAWVSGLPLAECNDMNI